MSDQPGPGGQAGTAAGNPPGWYLDPIGLHALRWWDGAHWARDTQPLLGSPWERPPGYPGAAPAAPGYPDAAPAAPGGPGAGRHRQQDGQHGGTRYLPDPPADPPPGSPAPPEPGQPHRPQGPPDQPSRAPGPATPARHAAHQRSTHKTRGALTGLSALIGSSSPSARRTRTPRHRQEP
jgi:hypothetical protein